MDKYKTNNFLRSKGFNVPQNALINKHEWCALDEIDHKVTYVEQLLLQTSMAFPLIVKPHDDGCSMMVSKASSIQELCSILDVYFTSNKTIAMLEELIRGFELTVGVIGNDFVQALPPSMAVAKGGILSIEEKFLPGAGENQTPAPLPVTALELVKKTIVDAYRTVGCKGYSRIDCFYQPAEDSPTGQERVVILEFNTLPALTPATCLFHQAAELGIKPMEFIDKIVELGFERHRMQHLNDEMMSAKSKIHEQETESKRKKSDKITLQAAAQDDFTMKLF